MTHEPECPYREGSSVRAATCSHCHAIRAAYRRGFNDHARSAQHWQDTHGAYRQVVTHQCPPDGIYLMPCCGISPLERLGDRMTLDPALVTCTGRNP